MNGVSGFGEGFVGGCAVEARDVMGDGMGAMRGGIRKASWRGLGMIESRLEAAGRKMNEV